VVRIAIVLALLAGVAHADEWNIEDTGNGPALRDRAGTPMVALRIGIGREPLAGDRRTVFTDGLQIGAAIGAGFRIAGELDLAYLLGDEHAAMDTRGFGVRGGLVVRHGLAHTRMFYADAEAGVGAIVGHDSRFGTLSRPEAFAGLRVGYDMTGSGSRSRIFEAAFDFRLVETADGLGWIAGVGIGWGG
jgi:hypothetical protein